MKRLASGLATLAVFALVAQAQTPLAPPGGDTARAVISGIVRDSLGLPVDGASVFVNPGALIFRTDSAGRFTARVAAATLRIALRRIGFAPLDTVVVTHAGVVLDAEFRMRRLPQALQEVVVEAEQQRQCPRATLEGVLCRREVGRGQFMNRADILATGAIYSWHVLRDQPGFRQNLNGDPRLVESTVGWRCIAAIVDGREVNDMNPVPRPQEMFAVEIYQPDEMPPEYQHFYWRGPTRCTLVVFWTERAVKQAIDRAAARDAGLTLEFAGGVMALVGGDYPRQTGLSFVGFFGSREPISPERVDIFGVSVSLLGYPPDGRPCAEIPGVECPGDTPFLLGIALERGTRRAALIDGVRYGAGAYMNVKDEGGAALGVHGQLDVTASFAMLSLRGVLLPNLHGRPVALIALTTGVRWR